jgi:hypothetical protein
MVCGLDVCSSNDCVQLGHLCSLQPQSQQTVGEQPSGAHTQGVRTRPSTLATPCLLLSGSLHRNPACSPVHGPALFPVLPYVPALTCRSPSCSAVCMPQLYVMDVSRKALYMALPAS